VWDKKLQRPTVKFLVILLKQLKNESKAIQDTRHRSHIALDCSSHATTEAVANVVSTGYQQMENGTVQI